MDQMEHEGEKKSGADVTTSASSASSSTTTAGTDIESIENGTPGTAVDWSNDASDRCNLIVNYLPHEIEDLSLKVLIQQYGRTIFIFRRFATPIALARCFWTLCLWTLVLTPTVSPSLCQLSRTRNAISITFRVYLKSMGKFQSRKLYATRWHGKVWVTGLSNSWKKRMLLPQLKQRMASLWVTRSWKLAWRGHLQSRSGIASFTSRIFRKTTWKWMSPTYFHN